MWVSWRAAGWRSGLGRSRMGLGAVGRRCTHRWHANAHPRVPAAMPRPRSWATPLGCWYTQARQGVDMSALHAFVTETVSKRFSAADKACVLAAWLAGWKEGVPAAGERSAAQVMAALVIPMLNVRYWLHSGAGACMNRGTWGAGRVAGAASSWRWLHMPALPPTQTCVPAARCMRSRLQEPVAAACRSSRAARAC